MAFGLMTQRRPQYTPHQSRFGTSQANPSDPYDDAPNWQHPMARQTFAALGNAVRGMMGQRQGAFQTLPQRFGVPTGGQQGYTPLAQNVSGNVGPAVAPPPGTYSAAEGALYRRRQAQQAQATPTQPTSPGGPTDRTKEAYNVYKAISEQPTTYGFEGPFSGYTPREQGFMSSVTQANQSDPAGPYSRGMFGLGGPRNPMGVLPSGESGSSPPPAQPRNLPTGTAMSGGSVVVHRPDGRPVLLPPGMERDVGGAIAQQKNASEVGMSGPDPNAVGMDAYRREAATRAAAGDHTMQRAINAGDKGIAYRGANLSPEAMARYRANRENRPLAGYATPMTPDQRAAIQAEAPNRRRQHFGLPALAAGQNQNGSTGSTTDYKKTPIAQRQAAYESSIQSPVIVGMQEQGFDPVGSSVHETMIGYRQGNENWSDADRQEFEKYLKSRYDYDTEFRKEMDGYLEADTVYSDDQYLAERNEYRRIFGKPPVKTTEPPSVDRGGGWFSF